MTTTRMLLQKLVFLLETLEGLVLTNNKISKDYFKRKADNILVKKGKQNWGYIFFRYGKRLYLFKQMLTLRIFLVFEF